MLRLPRPTRFTVTVSAVALALAASVGGAVTVAFAGSPVASPPSTRLPQRLVASPLPTVATATTAPPAPPTRATAVAPLRALVTPDLLVTGRRAVPLAVLRSASRVHAVLAVSVGAVIVRGASARGIAADPGQLRAWTPRTTAASNPLWQAIAAGEVASSFDLGKEKSLPLGGSLTLTRHGGAQVPVHLGALASTALPGVDLVTSPETGRALGFTAGAGALVSAPDADLQALRDRLQARLGSGYEVELVHAVAVQVVKDAGAFLTRGQLLTVLQSAQTQIGKPYMWGATGPDAFDCSGLVGWAFHAIGLQLPRTSEQLWLAGPHIAPQDARAGDLLFWANDPAAPMDIDHVAIYLGGGMMIAAPHTGDVVKVAPVYGQNFRGVVRLDPATAARIGGSQWSFSAHNSATAPAQG